MNSPLDLESRRLLISATLTAQARQRLGRRISADANADDLITLASKLEEIDAIERTHGHRFEPPYPGVTTGPRRAGEGLRLLLGCRASDADGNAIGVVFTALITGRPPQVSVAPVEAAIPEDWQFLTELR